MTDADPTMVRPVTDPWSEAGGAVGAEVLPPYDEAYSGWRAKVEAMMPAEVDFAEVWAGGRCVYCSAKINDVEFIEYRPVVEASP